MKVTDYIADFLAGSGVTHVFELSGGMIAHLLDSFSRHQAIRVVSVHHEQAGAFAAEAFARMSGKPAVALGTSGPGALNLVSGIASCYYDSIPAIFITGQVQTYLQRGERKVRQFGLQECGFTSVAKSIAKAVFAVSKAPEVPVVLAEAYAISVGGRPGPVVIEIPFDVQGSQIDVELQPAAPLQPVYPEEGAVVNALTKLAGSTRPLIVAGGGIRSARAAQAFRSFAEHANVPVVSSIMGLDLLPTDHRLQVGLIGTYGLRAANLTFAESDAVLVLGSRLDLGITGADTAAWKHGRQITHVDCDQGELGARVRGTTNIHADVGAFLEAANSLSGKISFHVSREWRDRVDELKAAWPDTRELEGCEGINPNDFIRLLSSASSPAAYIVDAGQHTWWVAQSVRLKEGQRLLASTGLWAMGSALPAGIGAALASGAPVVVIAGDGAMQVNIQELQTVVRNKLPLKIVVLNNRCHGMVRQFQEEFFDGRYPSTLHGYNPPDFIRVAQAYGISACSLTDSENVTDSISWLNSEPHAPRLLQVHVDTYTNVYPHVPFGKPITAMKSFKKACG